MPNEAQPNPQPAGAAGNGAMEQAITPELVNAIADQVYAMLVREMRVEKERLRRYSTSARGPGGD